MTTDTTSEISENAKKKKQIRRSDEGKQSKKESTCERGHGLDLWEVWSRNSHLPPLGVTKEHEMKIFKFTALKCLTTWMQVQQNKRYIKERNAHKLIVTVQAGNTHTKQELEEKIKKGGPRWQKK